MNMNRRTFLKISGTATLLPVFPQFETEKDLWYNILDTLPPLNKQILIFDFSVTYSFAAIGEFRHWINVVVGKVLSYKGLKEHFYFEEEKSFTVKHRELSLEFLDIISKRTKRMLENNKKSILHKYYYHYFPRNENKFYWIEVDKLKNCDFNDILQIK